MTQSNNYIFYDLWLINNFRPTSGTMYIIDQNAVNSAGSLNQALNVANSGGNSWVQIQVSIPQGFLGGGTYAWPNITCLEIGSPNQNLSSPITFGQFSFCFGGTTSTFSSAFPSITTLIIHNNVNIQEQALGAGPNPTTPGANSGLSSTLTTLIIGCQTATFNTSVIIGSPFSDCVWLPNLQNMVILSTAALQTRNFQNAFLGNNGTPPYTTCTTSFTVAGAFNPDPPLIEQEVLPPPPSLSGPFSLGSFNGSFNISNKLWSFLSGPLEFANGNLIFEYVNFNSQQTPLTYNFLSGPFSDLSIPSYIDNTPYYSACDLYILNDVLSIPTVQTVIDATSLGTSTPTVSQLASALNNAGGAARINVNIPDNFLSQANLTSPVTSIEIGDPTNPNAIIVGEFAFDLSLWSSSFSNTVTSIVIHPNAILNNSCFGNSSSSLVTIHFETLVIGGQTISNTTQYQFGSSGGRIALPKLTKLAILSTSNLNTNTFTNTYFGSSLNSIQTDIIVSGQAGSIHPNFINATFSNQFSPQSGGSVPSNVNPSVSTNFSNFIQSSLSGSSLSSPANWSFETQGPYGDVSIPTRLLTVPSYISDDLYSINYTSPDPSFLTVDQELLGTYSPTVIELANALQSFGSTLQNIKINVNVPPNFLSQLLEVPLNIFLSGVIEIGDPNSNVFITLGESAFDLGTNSLSESIQFSPSNIIIHKNVLMDKFCFGNSSSGSTEAYGRLQSLAIGGGYVSSQSTYQFGSASGTISGSLFYLALLSTASLNNQTFINNNFSANGGVTNLIVVGLNDQHFTTPNPTLLNHFTTQPQLSFNFQNFIYATLSGNILTDLTQTFDTQNNQPTPITNPLQIWNFSDGTYGDVIIPYPNYVSADNAILNIHVNTAAYVISSSQLIAIPTVANLSPSVINQIAGGNDTLLNSLTSIYAFGQAIMTATAVKTSLKITVDVPANFVIQYVQNFNDSQNLLTSLSNIQYLEFGDGVNNYVIGDQAFSVISQNSCYLSNLSLLIIHNHVVIGSAVFSISSSQPSQSINNLPVLQRLILGCNTSCLGQGEFGSNVNIPQLVHVILLSTLILNNRGVFGEVNFGTALPSLNPPEQTRLSVMSSEPENTAISTQHFQFSEGAGVLNNPITISDFFPVQANGSANFQNFTNAILDGDILIDESIFYDVTSDVSQDLTAPLQIWDFNLQGSYGDNIPQPPSAGFSQSFLVSSTTPVGTTIGSINVLSGTNPIQNYTGEPLGFLDTSNPTQSLFSISSSGIITLVQKLSLSFQSLIIPISIFESGNNTPVLTGSITIATSNTVNPSITIDPNQAFTIRNSASIGSFVGAISAHDPGTERFTFNVTSASAFFSVSVAGTINTTALLDSAPPKVTIVVSAVALNGIAISASQSIVINIIQTLNPQTFNISPTIAPFVIFGELTVTDDINNYLFEIISQPNSGPTFTLTPLFSGEDSTTEISEFATNTTAINNAELHQDTLDLPPNNFISLASGTLVSGNTYTMTVRAVNQVTFVHDDAIISVVAQDGPFVIIPGQVFTIINSQSNIGSVGYDNPSGGLVTFSPLTDPDLSNSDAQYFSISSIGALSVLTPPPVQTTHQILVEATAANNQQDSQTVTIVVLGNGPQVQNQTFNINTNLGINEIIGTIFVSDPDGNQVFLEITNPTSDSSNFALNNEDDLNATNTSANPYGNFTLTTSSLFPNAGNISTGGTVVLDIKATSSTGLSATATITINVGDYQHPLINQDQVFYIREDLAPGSFVGYIGALDPNGGSLTFTDETIYNLSNPQLFIVQDSGTIFTKVPLTLDTQILTINVTNSGGLSPDPESSSTLGGASTITINMISVLLNQTFEVNSTALPNRTFVSVSIDGNANDYTLAITENAAPNFVVASDTGNLSFSGTLGSVGTQYLITMTATDITSNVVHTAQMTIIVSLDDTFSIIPNQTFTISTNQTTVGNISYDNPTGGSVTFSPLPNNSLFTVRATGLLGVNGTNPGPGTYTVNVVANGMPSVPVTIVILTNNPIIQNAEFTISTNYGANKIIGTLFASDSEGLPITISILSATPSSAFSSFTINNNNQLTTSANFTTLPVETVTLSIGASDISTNSNSSSGGITQGVVLIQVVPSEVDVPIQTLIVSSSATSGTTFGPVIVTNPDNVLLNFALSTTTVFTINSVSGVLTVTNLTGFQSQNSFQLTVTVSSNNISKSAPLTIIKTLDTVPTPVPEPQTSTVVWIVLGVLGLLTIGGLALGGIALSKAPASIIPPLPEPTPQNSAFDFDAASSAPSHSPVTPPSNHPSPTPDIPHPTPSTSTPSTQPITPPTTKPSPPTTQPKQPTAGFNFDEPIKKTTSKKSPPSYEPDF